MLSRIWRVAHPLLTLAAVACCAWLVWKDWSRWYPEQNERTPEQELPQLHADEGLREFLSMRSIEGTYRLPEGENYGVIAVLWFENGKIRGRPDVWQITGTPGGTRVVSYQILWGKGADGAPRVVTVIREPGCKWSTTARKKTAELFSKLDGAFGAILSPPTEEVRGYRILGHAASEKVRPGQGQSFGSFDVVLKSRETVVAIGVKTFATRKEQDDCIFKEERADP